MKTPKFWKSKNLLSLSLLPLSLVYYVLYKLRVAINFRPYASKIPVICIGNTIAGGAGKTPVAIEIGKLLQKHNIKFAYLSKGYGGSFKKFTRVDGQKHSADLVGDEPLLLSEIADTFVCKSRAKGLKSLNRHKGYKYIIMDDGLQNPTFKKNIGILVINGGFGMGNGLILPAGALRETLSDSLKKVQAVVLMNRDKFYLRRAIKKHEGVELIAGEIREIPKTSFKKKSYIAFSGIGYPKKFFDSLEKAGAKVIKKIPFGDHHKYTKSDLEWLFSKAKELQAKLITTRKDLMRIDKQNRKDIEYLDIKIHFDKPKTLEKIILNK